MHDAAMQFVALACRDIAPERVLEFGSYNVNGTVRPLFWSADTYVGVDVRPGPGVDIVGTAAGYLGPPADVVVCCETLEHDPDPQATLESAWRNLEAGGLLILTAASPERAPHGCDGGSLSATEHYGGINPRELQAWLDALGFEQIAVTHQVALGDVYATARRPVWH